MNLFKTHGLLNSESVKAAAVNALTYFFTLLISVTFVATSFRWPGSIYTYILFTGSFNWLLYTAIKRQHSTGYLFLAVILWIGFWLKLSTHLLFSTVWMEPVGNFDFSDDSFDGIATISSVGAIGVWLSSLTFGLLTGKPAAHFQTASCKHNRYFWAAGLLLLATLIMFNELFQIVQAFRPPPELSLPFKIQGLISWYFGGGWGIILMIPFYISFCNKQDINAVILLMLAGVLVSITVFSRGLLVFQALIILLPLFVYKALLPRISVGRIAQYALVIVLGVCFSVIVAMERRSDFFESIGEATTTSTEASGATASSPSKWFYIAKLPIDRWIGLEGLMAVSSFSEKGYDFLLERSLEPRVTGQVDFYTHQIALNPTTDTKTVNYATPPGFIAFSYYSGSMLFVFIFTYLCSLVLIFSERLVLNISKNPFLASSIGIAIAVQLLHLGTGGLSGPIKIFIITLTVAIFLGWIQSQRPFRQGTLQTP